MKPDGGDDLEKKIKQLYRKLSDNSLAMSTATQMLLLSRQKATQMSGNRFERLLEEELDGKPDKLYN